jgi:hypothetical protein
MVSRRVKRKAASGSLNAAPIENGEDVAEAGKILQEVFPFRIVSELFIGCYIVSASTATSGKSSVTTVFIQVL